MGEVSGKTILIFGGTGSLGTELTRRWISSNQIVNYSRDEGKQFELLNQFPTVKNIIGDIRDQEQIERSLRRVDPNIIVICSALKHITVCEDDATESLKTNVLGVKNVLDLTESLGAVGGVPKLETVVFISTDKACSPINVYGTCKSLSEKLTIEKSVTNPKVKYVVTRYGNVLNSRGSIIPRLHLQGKHSDRPFTLTDPRMTRFIMSLAQSVQLIEYAITKAPAGCVCIPQIRAVRITVLFDIFTKLYSKNVIVTGIRPGEKLHEELISHVESTRTIYDPENSVYLIRPVAVDGQFTPTPEFTYSSNISGRFYSEDELRALLTGLELL